MKKQITILGTFHSFEPRISTMPKSNLKKRSHNFDYYYWNLMKLFCFCKSKKRSVFLTTNKGQKKPPRGVTRKRCSENMQQSYKRTPMPKWDHNKVAKQLYWNHISTWVCLPVSLLQFSEHSFSRTPLGGCV